MHYSVINQPEEESEATEDDYKVGNESPDKSDDDYQSDYAADEGEYYDYRAEDEDRKRTTKTTTPSTTPTTKTTTEAKGFISRTLVNLPIYIFLLGSDNSTQTYAGDYEDVDDHIRRTKNEGKEADICSQTFDTIGHIRSELFVFLGEKMWRFSRKGSLRPGYPGHVSQMFGFPKGFGKIDAVYERPDGNILFFTQDSFWISNGNSFIGQELTNY